jgi:hypothetical protein
MEKTIAAQAAHSSIVEAIDHNLNFSKQNIFCLLFIGYA